MTRDRWHDDPEACAEAEALYAFLGRYMICFQWLEGKIDETLLMAKGHKNRDETFDWLSKKSMNDKIKEFQRTALDNTIFHHIKVPGWYEHLENVIRKLHSERERRNGLLHSQYLFDFLAIGRPVLRTHVRKSPEGAVFDQEELSPARRDQIFAELADLSIELGQIHMQLIHVYHGSE